MTDYHELTDSEINSAVSQHVSPNLPRRYCETPAGAWPVITFNLIAVEPVYKGQQMWLAHAGDDGEFRCLHENPLRAAMTVYLKIKEAKG